MLIVSVVVFISNSDYIGILCVLFIGVLLFGLICLVLSVIGINMVINVVSNVIMLNVYCYSLSCVKRFLVVGLISVVIFYIVDISVELWVYSDLGKVELISV